VVGQPLDRIDGPLKTTGTAPYAYDRHDVAPTGLRLHRRLGIAKGRIVSIDLAAPRPRPACSPSSPPRTPASSARATSTRPGCSGGPVVEHYHQAVALVVAETFEQARAAAQLVRVDVRPREGAFDLAAQGARPRASTTDRGQHRSATSPARSPRRPVQLDATYSTPTSRTR
jgi:xanthine dehydrogenase YagR molybdenum-binding subunit